MSKPLQTLVLASVTLVAAIASSISSAGTPTGPYAVFQHCPYATVPDAKGCVYATISSGSFTMGNAQAPIVVPVILQGGIQNPFFASPFYPPTDGTPPMSPSPQPVPGGLLGLVNPAPTWPFPLWQAFWNIVNSVNGVTATTEAVGPVQTNFFNVLYPPTDGSDPTAIQLPIRIHLQNPLLGDTCYIGSPSNPIVLNLQAGTTNPPAPNRPISGNSGVGSTEPTTNPTGTIIHDDGVTLVDNSFAVPAAAGCGNVALGLPIITPLLEALVSGAVNLKEGLPSPAGKNTAIMNGSTEIANKKPIIASESP